MATKGTRELDNLIQQWKAREQEMALAQWIREERQRAEQGDAEAQYQIGKRYLTGQGLSVNQSEALVLLTKAAVQQHREAHDLLKSAWP